MLARLTIAAVLLVAIGAPSASSQPYLVTNTGDSGTGSLRWAIEQANANPGRDEIHFDIPGAGPHTIAPLSQLPTLTDQAGVVIDGLTQPGGTEGNDPPSTAVLMIEIEGSNAGAANGLHIQASNDSIQGLVINRFDRDGILIESNSTNLSIEQNAIRVNFIGTNVDGTQDRGNAGTGITIQCQSDGEVYYTWIHDNLISANDAEGIHVWEPVITGEVAYNWCEWNYIGTDISGTADVGNALDGVRISNGAHDIHVNYNLICGNDKNGVALHGMYSVPSPIVTQFNTISTNRIGVREDDLPLPNAIHGVAIGYYGATALGFANDNSAYFNWISANGGDGVAVWEHPSNLTNADRNLIWRNRTWDNYGLGIDLGNDGVTLNDGDDSDAGPNQEINFPIIQNVDYDGTWTYISGTVNVHEDPRYDDVDIYLADVDPTGYGEGKQHLISAEPDGDGNWSCRLHWTELDPGDYVTANRRDADNNYSEFCPAVAVTNPDVITVDNTNDSGPGSLRWAVDQANVVAGFDNIEFDIPGPGPHIISPTSQLPAITDEVHIDGFSQPGAVDGNWESMNLAIVIDGTLAGASHGLVIDGFGVHISGLVINDFQLDGIRVDATGDAYFCEIRSCFVGTEADGVTPAGNGGAGIRLQAATPPGIVTDTDIIACLISNNQEEGIYHGDGASEVEVVACRVGTDRYGVADLGNQRDGILLDDGGWVVADCLVSGNAGNGIAVTNDNMAILLDNVVGKGSNGDPLPNSLNGIALGLSALTQPGYTGHASLQRNEIAYNLLNGICVWEDPGTNDNADGNEFWENEIHDNGGLGIDLGNDGVTINDAGDTDVGPNQELNFPAITGVTHSDGQTTFEGTLDIDTDPTAATVYVYLCDNDPSGYGEGEELLGAAIPAAGGAWSCTVNGSIYGCFSAVTVDEEENTSEFSLAYEEPDPTLLVTNTDDIGAGSLRWAITQANGTAGHNEITFDIPGMGPHTITPATPLPALTDPDGATIDGTTQEGVYCGDTPPATAVLMIEINGDNLSPYAHGIEVRSSNNVIRGLVINRFPGNCIYLEGGDLVDEYADNNAVQCCFLGTDVSGTSAPGGGSGWNGVHIKVTGSGSASENLIEGNLLSGLGANGVAFEGPTNQDGGELSFNEIRQNLIGTDISGVADLGNGDNGILIRYSTHSNTISENIIGYNDYNGIVLRGYTSGATELFCHSNVIENNRIGLNLEDEPIPNTNRGIAVGSDYGYAIDNQVTDNIIAYNGWDGITVVEHTNTTTNADGNEISFNSFYDNGGLSIDLGNDDVTVNDTGDPDAGPNQSLNFPVITNVTWFETICTIEGTLDIDGDASQARVEIYIADIDETSHGEGRTGLVAAIPAATGEWLQTLWGVRETDYLTALAVDENNNTSEFCLAVHATNQIPITVTTTDDSGPGSLRAAIDEANGRDEHVVIDFDIPGPGQKSIILNTPLPALTNPDGITMDGFTQGGGPGADPPSTADWTIELQGGGLHMMSGNNTITGLAIAGSTGDGIFIEAMAGASSNTIDCNYIHENDGAGVRIEALLLSAGDNTICNNLVSGNLGDGIYIFENPVFPNHADANKLDHNMIYDNGELGIDLQLDGPNTNDAGDADQGANQEINSPDIIDISYDWGVTTISGTIDIDSDPAQAVVEIFRAVPDQTGYGEGELHLGYAYPNAMGEWTFELGCLSKEEYVTAVVRDVANNTSEFCCVANAEEGIRKPGDLNNDGVIDLDDVVYLQQFLSGAGPAPQVLSNADVNGSCCIDSDDSDYLEDYIFADGPAPVVCTCVEPGLPGDVDADGEINVADVVYLVDYVSGAGPAPPIPSYADVDGDCCIWEDDIAYLTALIYSGGDPGICSCPDPELGPCLIELVAEPHALLDPFNTKPNQAVDTTIVLTNMGSTDADFTVSVNYISGNAWLGVSPVSGSIAPSVDNAVTLDITATGPTSEGLYQAEIVITHNDTKGTTIVPVDLYSFEEFHTPLEDADIRTTQSQLNVRQASGIGNQKSLYNYYWFADLSSYLLDASLILATDRENCNFNIYHLVGEQSSPSNPWRELRALTATSSDSTSSPHYRYAEGTGCTADSTIEFLSRFYASKHPDSAGFFVAHFDIYSGPKWTSDITDLKIAYACDWDVPSDIDAHNSAGVLPNEQAVYQKGEYEGSPSGNNDRYAAVAYRADEETYSPADGGFALNSDEYVYPENSYHVDSLIKYIDQTETTDYFTVELSGLSISDFSSIIVADRDAVVEAANVISFSIIVAATLPGEKSLGSLQSSIAKAERFICDYVAPDAPHCQICMCGDADGNGIYNISDAVYLISYIFGGGPAPDPMCLGDADGNGIVNISDAVYLIAYIFGGGPEPHCP